MPKLACARSIAVVLPYLFVLGCASASSTQIRGPAHTRQAAPIPVTSGAALTREVDAYLSDPSRAAAQSTSQPAKSDWGGSLIIYGWLAGVKGTVAGDGGTEIDIPFETFFDLTDAGFQMYAEVRWRKWFIGFDGTWAKLAIDREGTLLDLQVSIRQKIFEVRFGYRVFERTLEAPAPAREGKSMRWGRAVAVDAFVGARYFYTRIKATTTPIVGSPIVVEDLDERIDPFFGARVGWQFAQRWALIVRGDIGGFGIGDAAQFTWQFSANVAFRITRRIDVFVGYRLLSYDTITGSGDDESGTDLLQHGPQIGASYRF